jgi:hypothetical protein
LCRGEHCGATTLDGMPCAKGSATFEGEIGGTLECTCDFDRFHLQATGTDDPRVLADGTCGDFAP